MKNRLELNKKKVYELPESCDMRVEKYCRGVKTPDFEPDIVLVGFGRNIGEKTEKYKHLVQIWLKTDDKKLINFIEGYKWRSIYNKAPNATLSINIFKKILLEEFYGIKDRK